MPDPTHPPYADDAVVNVETRHEESDVNVKALLWFVVIFIVFAAVVHVGLWLLFRFYAEMEKGGTANAPLTAVARPPDASIPPLPRLQPFPTRAGNATIPPYGNTPVTDLVDMRAAEDKVLNNYGWVDKSHGVVHIPIEQAKQLALQNGTYQVQVNH